MYLFTVALHVVLCVFLILIIILQPGKGGDVGAAFGGGGGGGGGSTMFGPRGPTNLLQRATTVVAVLFMCTSLTLAWYSNESVMSDSNVEDELERLANEEEEQVEADEAGTKPPPVIPDDIAPEEVGAE